MDKTYVINIAEVIAPIVASRDAVTMLRDKINQAQEAVIQLDMSEVQFISRAAAHEFLILKESFVYQEPKKIVEFVHPNESVTMMLRTVAANRAVPKERVPLPAIKRVLIEELKI